MPSPQTRRGDDSPIFAVYEGIVHSVITVDSCQDDETLDPRRSNAITDGIAPRRDLALEVEVERPTCTPLRSAFSVGRKLLQRPI
jgi:hypothetical protein